MRTSQNTKGPGKKNKKNSPRLFVTYMQEKLAVTVMVITLALFALIVVLYQLIKNNQEDYSKIVLSQQSYDSRVIPYRRGDIVDRNGTYLATSEKVYNLIIDPMQINSAPEHYLEPTVQALSEVFGYDAAELRSIIAERAESAYVRYERRLPHEQKKAFEELKEKRNTAYKQANSKERVWGVWFEDEYQRVYPLNSLACDVVGFSTADGSGGMGGIEQFYNEELIGVNGREYGYLNEETNLERVIKPAANGNTVVSTLDVNIQQIAEKYIAEWENTTGSNMSAALVMNPQNGEILALVNVPEFNLNDPFTLDQNLVSESARLKAAEEAALGTDAQERRNRMWRNSCVSDTYEPGSTFKIITAAAGLEAGAVTLEDRFSCPGFRIVEDRKIRCHKVGGHGAENFLQGMMNSCNPVLIDVGQRLGTDAYYRYFEQFGLKGKTGIDIPGEASTIMHKKENMGPVELATVSFGQSFQITPVQLIATVSSIINGGRRVTPHFAVEARSADNTWVHRFTYPLGKEILSAQTSETMRYILEHVVSEGSGKKAAIEGYRIGGKTATSEKLPRSRKKYISSFIGFAPADEPSVIALITIDEPEGIYYGGTIAAPVIADLFRNILPAMGI